VSNWTFSTPIVLRLARRYWLLKTWNEADYRSFLVASASSYPATESPTSQTARDSADAACPGSATSTAAEIADCASDVLRKAGGE